MVSSGVGSSVAGSLLGQSGMLTLLFFSRAQEEEADATGVAALVRAYGHAGGATETFRVLDAAADEPEGAAPPEFLSTHPVTQERVATLASIIGRNGWAPQGARVPIPAAVVSMMTGEAKP